MPYPHRLIPRSADTKITDLDSILEDVLCRWVSAGKELKDQQDSLAAEAVEEKKLFGYSVNKIPPSEVEDILIAFHDTAKFNQEWTEGNDGVNPNDNDYYKDESRKYFLLKIGDVHNYEGKYPYPADPKAAPNYIFKVQVAHKPLIANYSHFEFDIKFYELNGLDVAKIEPSRSSASRKLIVADLRQHLIRKAKFSVEELSL
jgi:hypothetical protein